MRFLPPRELWLPGPAQAVTVLVIALAPLPTTAAGQGVVVDQGTFVVSLEGRRVGSEEFTIRRAGFDRDDALFATATVDVRRGEGSQQVRLLMRATPFDGLPKCEGTEPCYQVDVEGAGAMSLRLGLSGRRYVARIVDSAGEEIREFPAAPGTRILELDVAHLYYFVRSVPVGATSPILSPMSRTRSPLRAETSIQEQIQLGPNVVQARRVEFTTGDLSHIVWYDRFGRVLRVSVPGRGYLAERTDLVG